MPTISERNCFTCAWAAFFPGFPSTDSEPVEVGDYRCMIGLAGALEHEVLAMPDCDGYVLDPELADD